MDGSLSLRERRNAAAGVTPIYLRGLVEKGTQCFRDRDYKKALGYLDKAIREDSDPPLLVLDKKAATAVKLGDCDAAIAVARQIIKRDQANAIGYLRLGQVLQCQKQQEKAFKVYEKALRLVSPEDMQKETLQRSRDKLSTMLGPKNAVDPLARLPNELVTMIQHNLEFLDIVNMSRVCSTWRQRLRQEKTLWTDLDFSGAHRPVAIEAVRTYAKRSGWKVWRCSTCRLNKDPKPLLFYLADRCKVLRELHYEQSIAGDTLFKAIRVMPCLIKLILAPNCEIKEELCHDILQQGGNLQHVEFHVVRGRILSGPRSFRELGALRTLIFNRTKGDEQFIWDAFVQTLTKVRHLEMQNWHFAEERAANEEISGFASLESLNLAGCTSVRSLPLPSCLMELNLNNGRFHKITNGLESSSPVPSLSRLTRLSLAAPRAPFDPAGQLYSWLNSNKGNHVELNLNYHLLATSEIETLINDGYLDSIEILKLRQCDLNDAVVASLGSRCHFLRVLDMGYTSVTGVGVKELLMQSKPNLRWLGLDGCSQINPDAVQWAREQGIRVSFNFQGDGAKGKKVRLS